MDQNAGNLRFGDWLVQGEIGRGGMGVVYEVHHAATGEVRALKILQPAIRPEDGRRIERFRRELRAVGRLRHPSIVLVHDVSESAGRPYYVMDLVRNGNLEDLIFDVRAGRIDRDTFTHRLGGAAALRDLPMGRRPLDARGRLLALRFAAVAEGLHAAHEQGLVHRDLKPGNLLLADDGRLMISDFGLVRGLGEDTLTRTGEIIGTPLYSSPEQLRRGGPEVDRRSDVYSLAASLYEALTLTPPHEADDLAQLALSVREDEPDPPSLVIEGLSHDVDRVVLKALAKQPDERYADAAAFAADLRALSEGRRPAARSPGLKRRLVRASRRAPLLATAALVLLIVDLGLGLRLMSLEADRRDRATQRLEATLQDFESFYREKAFALAAGALDRAKASGLAGAQSQAIEDRLAAALRDDALRAFAAFDIGRTAAALLLLENRGREAPFGLPDRSALVGPSWSRYRSVADGLRSHALADRLRGLDEFADPALFVSMPYRPALGLLESTYVAEKDPGTRERIQSIIVALRLDEAARHLMDRGCGEFARLCPWMPAARDTGRIDFSRDAEQMQRSERRGVILAALEAGTEEAVGLLLAIAGSRRLDPESRALAILALGGRPEGEPARAAGRSDPDELLREAAILATAAWGMTRPGEGEGPQSRRVESLTRLLESLHEDPAASVRAAAVRGLLVLGIANAGDLVLDAFEAERKKRASRILSRTLGIDPFAPTTLGELLGDLSAHSRLKGLVPRGYDGAGSVEAAAADFVAALGEREKWRERAATSMRVLLAAEDTSLPVRAAAWRALAAVRGDESPADLAALAFAMKGEVRLSAALALGKTAAARELAQSVVPGTATAFLERARFEAAAGETELAMDDLYRATALGLADPGRIGKDPWLMPLLGMARVRGSALFH